MKKVFCLNKTTSIIFAALFVMVVLDAIQVIQPIVDDKPVFVASQPIHGSVEVTGKSGIGLTEIMRLEPVETVNQFGDISAGFDVVNVDLVLNKSGSLPAWYVATLADKPIVAALVNAVKNQQGQIDEIVYTINDIIQ